MYSNSQPSSEPLDAFEHLSMNSMDAIIVVLDDVEAAIDVYWSVLPANFVPIPMDSVVEGYSQKERRRSSNCSPEFHIHLLNDPPYWQIPNLFSC